MEKSPAEKVVHLCTVVSVQTTNTRNKKASVIDYLSTAGRVDDVVACRDHTVFRKVGVGRVFGYARAVRAFILYLTFRFPAFDACLFVSFSVRVDREFFCPLFVRFAGFRTRVVGFGRFYRSTFRPRRAICAIPVFSP